MLSQYCLTLSMYKEGPKSVIYYVKIKYSRIYPIWDTIKALQPEMETILLLLLIFLLYMISSWWTLGLSFSSLWVKWSPIRPICGVLIILHCLTGFFTLIKCNHILYCWLFIFNIDFNLCQSNVYVYTEYVAFVYIYIFKVYVYMLLYCILYCFKS